MSNAFPPPPFPPPTPPLPPPTPDHESVPLIPVVPAHHVAWPKKRWLKLPLWAWIVAGVLGIGVAGVVADGGGKQNQATGNRTGTTEVTGTPNSEEATAVVEQLVTVPATSSAPTAPPFTLPIATTAPSTAAPETVPAASTSTDREAFLDWVVREDLSSLSNELLVSLDPVIAASEDLDWDGLGIACGATHDVNERLAATLPSPSNEMNTAMTNMTDDFDTALHLCQEATATYDPDLLMQASDYMNRAAAHAQEVTAILDTL